MSGTSRLARRVRPRAVPAGIEVSTGKRVTTTAVALLVLAAIAAAAAIPSARDGLYFANLALAGILLGKEVTTFLVITPAARSLPVPAQVRMQQALMPPFRNLGPVVFNLVLVTGIALAASVDAPGRYFEIAGSACIAAMLVAVFKVSVPINLWTAEQTVDVDPAVWAAQRRRWDGIQVVRLLLDAAALTCFLLALLTNT